MRLCLPLIAATLLAAPTVLHAQTSVPGASQAMAPRSPTMDAMRTSGHLECGVVQVPDDWNSDDIHGDLSDFEEEVCKAVATAVLGSAEAASIHEFSSEFEALDALRSGTIQLAAGMSPSAATATHLGIAYGRPIYYDSQRLLVAKQSGVRTIEDLRDKLICALEQKTPEQSLRDEMTARGISYALQSHSEQGEMDAAIAVIRCKAGTGMETRLAQSRANFHARVSDFFFLPERWALSPMVVATRYGDQAFSLAVNDTVDALIEAEALGITQANIAQASAREDMATGQLLGHDFAVGQALGLPHDWAEKVIAAVGNYGEVFDRAVGQPLHLERGLNALWTQGGLMAPAPMQ